MTSEYQVKYFRETHILDLQLSIDEWLGGNPGVTPISISHDYVNTGYSSTFTAIILYRVTTLY